MKRNVTLRSAALIAACAFAVTSVSCGKKKDKEEEKTADKLLKCSYSSNEITADLDMTSVRSMEYIPETEKLFLSGYSYDEKADKGKNLFCITDPDFSDLDTVEVDDRSPENGESSVMLAPASDGNVWAFYSITDYGDYELPDYSDENFDWEHYDPSEAMSHASYSYYLAKYDPSGNEISGTEVKGLEKENDASEYGAFGGFWTSGISETGSGDIMANVSAMEDMCVLISPEGECKGKLESDNMMPDSTAIAADGRIAYIGYNDSDKLAISYIDPETLEADGESIEVKDVNGWGTLFRGCGDYNVMIKSELSLFGVTKDGKMKEVINWIDSDISGSDVGSVAALGEEDYIISVYGDRKMKFFRLAPRDMEQLKNTKVVTVAVMYADWEITEKIAEFNQQDNGYRIKINDYSKYYEYDKETDQLLNYPSKQFQLDLVAGEMPDMLIANEHPLVRQLAGKGVFADLYDMMEKDDEFKKEDIMPNVLKANEIDGKLVSINPSFSVRTWAVGKEMGDLKGWTLNDLIEVYDKNKDKMSLTSMDTRESILYSLMETGADFIDYKKGECYFDSPDFIKLLNFCKQFPSEEDVFPSDDDSDVFETVYEEGELKLRNKQVITDQLYLYDPREYARTKQGKFGRDIELVGIPGLKSSKPAFLDGNKYYCIMAKSQYKDECWDIVKSAFAKDYDSENMWMFPSAVSAFEQCMTEAMSKPYYRDENGKKVEYDDNYYLGNEIITIDPLTQEEVDYLTDFIKSADTISGDYSEEAMNIVTEEVMAFFKDEKTAEETAAMLQNRIGLLISEES